MLPHEVSEAQPATVVIDGFTPVELDEIRRGLVQRMSVAQSNIRDKRNKYDTTDWRDMYEACWSAYSKISKALAKANVQLSHDSDTEFDYLSKPVGED